ncbi:unnamed protein product [Malus baccata var. baccata]
MTNISMSPFTNEIKRTDPPRGFTMPHFTSYKGDEDPDRHLNHYRNTRLCEFSFNRSIKMISDHLFSIVKDPRETIHNHVKRFKAEKAKIVGCNEDITTTTFRNRRPTEHHLFEKLIIKEELTLVASYALAEKHALWDEAKQSNKNESEKKHMECFSTKEDSGPETFTKFTFELPPPMKNDLTRLDHTKYCTFHQRPGHTTNDCLKWKQYLEKLTNDGRCDEYLDRSTKQPTQAREVSITP